jgi:hypothetical protein
MQLSMTALPLRLVASRLKYSHCHAGVTERDFKPISLALLSCWFPGKSVDCVRFEACLMNKFTKLLSGYQPTFRKLTVITKGFQKACF